jgi:septal ring factor EnvC (AmiA/AmiB activator)
MKWSGESFSRHAQTICAIVLLAVTIFLLVQTIILTQLASHSSWGTDQIAYDTAKSREYLDEVKTDISELVTGLTGEDSQLIKQLTGIQEDTEATKDALAKIEDDIDAIRSDVRNIELKLVSIEKLLTPPSD